MNDIRRQSLELHEVCPIREIRLPVEKKDFVQYI